MSKKQFYNIGTRTENIPLEDQHAKGHRVNSVEQEVPLINLNSN
jgi:hypothetical protein